jgi:riboflavin kinase/FMN adenylyltransferase
MNNALFVCPPSQPIHVIGMGVFDGIHRGHQHVLESCDTLLTFEPHPQKFFKPSCQLHYLTPIEEKKTLFNHVVALRFDTNMAQLSPLSFLELIKAQLSPQKIIVGYDFKFGKQKQGTSDALLSWGKSAHVDILIKEPYLDNNRPVKSSTIRTCIENGDMERANYLLGRPYTLIGKVVAGDQRGRQLGYPTANLVLPEEKLVPKQGVYYGSTMVSGNLYRCGVSIGTQPTFNTQKTMIEAHLIGFKGELYGQELTIQIHSFIRSQCSFNSNDALTNQIKKDIQMIGSLNDH